MAITYLFAGIPTADFSSALDWYERFFGCRPDRFPHETEAVWQLATTSLVYLVADPDRAGKALVTLIVDDLVPRVEALAKRGIELGAIETMSGVAMQRVDLTDLDGNRLAIAQQIGAGT